MVQVSLRCPFCGNDDVGKNGHSNGKQRYLCCNSQCPHQTFYAEYTYGDFSGTTLRNRFRVRGTALTNDLHHPSVQVLQHFRGQRFCVRILLHVRRNPGCIK